MKKPSGSQWVELQAGDAGTHRGPIVGTTEYWALVDVQLSENKETLEFTRRAEGRNLHDYAPHTLWAFIRLADRDRKPTAFLNFAKRYGSLGLCEEHCCPYHHFDPIRSAYGHPFQDLTGLQAQPCNAGLREPIAAWRGYATEARAMLAIANEIHLGRTGRTDDWEMLDQGIYPPGATEWARLGVHVHEWIEWAALRPRLWWGDSPNDVEPELGADSLFGQLAQHLAFTMAKRTGIASCEACRALFEPNRRGQQYCSSRCSARIRQRKRRAG